MLEEALDVHVTQISSGSEAEAEDVARRLVRARAAVMAQAGRRAGAARRRRARGQQETYDYWADPAHALQRLLIERKGRVVTVTNTAHPDHISPHTVTVPQEAQT